MSKSVLVLEENLAIQGLIASSLPPDLLSLHQESDPESFLQQARAVLIRYLQETKQFS